MRPDVPPPGFAADSAPPPYDARPGAGQASPPPPEGTPDDPPDAADPPGADAELDALRRRLADLEKRLRG
jgi:hypothetical protein